MKVLLILINTIIITTRINAICNEFANTEWKMNGTNCGKFCADLLTPENSVFCDPTLNHLGCFCKDGYYRASSLDCVVAEDCFFDQPQQNKTVPQEYVECPHNEGYDTCSSRCLEQCSKREDPISCPINCDTGCFCRNSRLRNNDGICVPILECEPISPDSHKFVCPQGERYLECGNRCQELCPNTRNFYGISLNCERCEPGCFCEPGLLRGKLGTCVEKQRCDPKSILGNILTTIFNVVFSNRFSFKGKLGFRL